MSVTIKDIAADLNLNFSSVSRALNNKPGVSENTRKLVLKKAEELGYQPNTLARGLVSSDTKTIGVIMPDITNPVFGAITTGIIETAKAGGYDVFLCISNWSAEKEKQNIHAILEKQVEGIIAKTVGSVNSALLTSADIPVVGFESWSSIKSFSSVSTDNKKSGFVAGEHLFKCGYRNTILLPGPENSIAAKLRCRGFFHSQKEHGIDPDESRIFYGDYNIESGYQLISELIVKHPEIDSVMAGNDVIAIGVLKYLEENGIKPGKDIGLIGFDNITVSGLPHIELTTIKQQKYSTGKIMTDLLFKEMTDAKNGLDFYPQRILLEPDLIVRNTTCRYKPN